MMVLVVGAAALGPRLAAVFAGRHSPASLIERTAGGAETPDASLI
jgi:hypothetical protein